MSSAFLYVGIVAIWAFVLVPRWLRRPQALPEPAAEFEASYSDDAGYGEPHGHELGGHELGGHELGGHEQDGYQQGTAGPGNADATAATAATAAGATTAATEPGRRQRAAARQPVPPLPRSRVLQARRRLLTLLVLLCAAAAACTVLKLTSWWACVPPAGMLGMYLLLLREAALADAEQTRRRAAMELRVQAARQRADAAWVAEADEHSAEIIDISARVGDQLYDQYADATIRAVGD